MSRENDNEIDQKTWLITGASSGLGHALARHVLEQGDRVVMGARTLSAMEDRGALPGHGARSHARRNEPRTARDHRERGGSALRRD